MYKRLEESQMQSMHLLQNQDIIVYSVFNVIVDKLWLLLQNANMQKLYPNSLNRCSKKYNICLQGVVERSIT